MNISKKLFNLTLVFSILFGSITLLNLSNVSAQEKQQEVQQENTNKYFTIHKNSDGSTEYSMSESQLRLYLKSKGYTDEQLGILGLARWSIAGVTFKCYGPIQNGNFDIKISKNAAVVLRTIGVAANLTSMFISIYGQNYLGVFKGIAKSVNNIIKLPSTHGYNIKVRKWRIK